MTEAISSVREATKYLSHEHDQYGYVETENTWIIDIFRSEDQVDAKSEMLYYAATRPEGRPHFLSVEQFEELAEQGIVLREGLPNEVKRLFFGDTEIKDPEGDKYARITTSRTVYSN